MQQVVDAVKRFDRAFTAFQLWLSYFRLRDPHSLEDLEEQIAGMPGWGEGEKKKVLEECKSKMLEIAKLGLEHDANIHVAFKYFRALGREDLIQKRLAKSMRHESGETYTDLFYEFLNRGTTQKAEEAIRDWIEDAKMPLIGFEGTKYFSERLKPIHAAYEHFARSYGLEDQSFTPDLAYINAACELKKRHYDVVIGVLNSGLPLAAFMDFLGQPTRYVEWHRHWKTGPKWRKMGSDHARIKGAKKILVAEHDTHTGKTLEVLAPFLEKLHPDIVDVAFNTDRWETNQQHVSANPMYHEQVHVRSMPLQSLVENLNDVTKHAKEYLARQGVTKTPA